MISKKHTNKNLIPSISTYKLRYSELFYNGIRVMPSYIITGGNILIEKSIKNNWTEIDKKQVEITLDEGTNYLALEKPVENASIEELPPTKVQL